MINSRAVLIAGIVGTVLQIAMVVAGHASPSVAAMFAVGGMSISLIAGVIYGYLARGPRALGGLIAGGATAGGICAFIGILVSHLMGDVPASLLLLGTISSIVTGAIGGAIGKAFGSSVAAIALIASMTLGSSSANAQTPVTTQDFSWLAGRWQGNHGEAYESSFKQVMRLKTHSADRDIFENLVPYDKSLMSTQPRLTTFQRVDANSFTGHSDIIASDGKPTVVEVKYHRLAAS